VIAGLLACCGPDRFRGIHHMAHGLALPQRAPAGRTTSMNALAEPVSATTGGHLDDPLGDDPLVSVVVVNFNGLALLGGCLDSLRSAFVTCAFEVIVVDNASTDGSRDYLRSRRDIRLIESEVNTGFSGGNNIGVRSARGKFVLLLNNDTVCLGPLDPLLECMDDARCGVAGCALYFGDGRLQPSVGRDHTPLRVVLSWLGLGSLGSIGVRLKAASWFETDPGYYRHRQRPVDWVSGACLLTRADIWRRIGGLDEAFFMYCEDVDYCRRVRAAGFEVSYTPAAGIRHYEAAGRPWVGRVALLRTARSHLVFMGKHYGSASQLFVGASLGLVLLSRSLVYRLMAWAQPGDGVIREKIGAYFDAAAYLFSHALTRNAAGAAV
jgi:GT2 family glycosyltransferase